MKQQIIEGNKLILQYEGLNPETKHRGVLPEYHKDWNRLMPVVLKIMREDFGGDEGFKLEMLSNNVTSCTFGTLMPDVPVLSWQEESPIIAVWQTVVNYLKNK